MKKRLICLLLALTMLLSMTPLSVFAAHDATGRPLDLKGDVYLALYTGGKDFPGEPAEFAVSGYLNLNQQFTSPGFTVYADSAEGVIKPQILDDVVQGTSGVWGVFSTTGGSKYLDPADGIVNADGTHNKEVEQKIIQTAIDNKKFTLGAGESIDDYTIIWYVIKYQRSDSAWHIDGLITKKTTYAVNYYGNGNTSGAAPTGANDLKPGTEYTVLPNTGNLRKTVGRDTYIFNGWNTNADGTGVHYDAGDKIVIGEENITLYAEWYLQNKYTVTVVTKLDDTEENVENIFGQPLTVWVRLNDEGEYLELEKGAAGTYSVQVTENGTYHVYFRDADGTFHPAENYLVTIYNQNGRTELLNYSVSYDANAGGDTVTWSQGTAPETQIHHATHTVVDGGNVPERPGYIFLYWTDQNGKIIYPGDTITDRLLEKTVLTAQWEKTISVTVNVTIDHNAEDGDDNHLETMSDLTVYLMREFGFANLQMDEAYLDETHSSYEHVHDQENGIHYTTYSVTFPNMPQGKYTATATKNQYTTEVTHTGAEDTDQTIEILLTYAPSSFDLTFDVVVNADTEAEKELMPKAVNVKVYRWDYDDNDVLGWHVVDRQAGDAPPITVTVDENGRGSGYFPVWQYRSDSIHAYEYRVVVTAFVMPDGSVVPATGDLMTYLPDGTGLYSAEVTIEPEGTGRVPSYPTGSNTGLSGAYFNGTAQNGVPTVTVEIEPFTVTFVAGDGTLDGQQTVVLKNQYKYPDLRNFVPVPNNADDFFTGWLDAQGKPVQNLNGQYLTGDVTYYAGYSVPITVEGTVVTAGSYEQNGVTVHVAKIDLVDEVMVVLQKDINGNLVDVASQIVPITYKDGEEDGSGFYRFEDVPNDGTVYRISVLANNYDNLYDNESDEGISYSESEYTAILGDDTVAQVHAHLSLNPEFYTQMMEVDATQIAPDFRPAGALAEILYRDLGDIHQYNLIAQHKNPPYGEEIPLAANGKGSGSYDIWKYHTSGGLYEYQMNLSKLYGNVPGVFAPEGTEFNSDTAPYIIEYAPASRYSAVEGGQARTLKATLIPKQYEIIFDMGLEPGETVEGMDQYLTDGGTGEDYYSDLHTWSFESSLMAFPYRAGYVFEGWEDDPDRGVKAEHGGYITIGAAVAEDVVLKAKWRKLEGTDYTVRHLELNTDKPLHGAVVVEGAVAGTVIKAVDKVLEIEGYDYAGAKIGDKLYSLNEEPEMTVTASTTENVMIIYYLPDSSSGYTEQVESNLKLDKTATLEDNGTYTINLETYTMDNPVTTLIQQNTPLDIVLVIDQSGSIIQSGYLDDLQAAVDNFIELIADHGRKNEVDHRIAMVGYAGDKTCDPTGTNTSQYPIAGGNTSTWVNTGVFDSNGDFHPYTVTGFNYTKFTGKPEAGGTYYTYSDGEYLLLTHHDEYRHLISEEEARIAALDNIEVFGYVYDSSDIGSFVKLERNTSGLWLYGDKQLYSSDAFFTYHKDVWTHRRDLDSREIHAYGTGNNYTCTDGHDNLYTRQETTNANPDLNVYYDALVPVSVGINGAGGTNPHLLTASSRLGSNGGTYVQYGIEMANKIFAANPVEGTDRVRVMVMFTDGLPGTGTFDESEANAAIKQAYTAKNTHNAYSYTIGLYPSAGVDATSDVAIYMNATSSNYKSAQSMDDVYKEAGYAVAKDGSHLADGNTYFVKQNNNYYEVKYGNVRLSGSWSRTTCWYYTRNWLNYSISTEVNPVVSGGKVGSTEIYVYEQKGYKEPDGVGYYSTTESEDDLKAYFANVMREITTKITKEIILHEDTILRDIMGQGLVMTPGTVITAYKVPGTYQNDTGEILWDDTREKVAQVTIPANPTGTIYSPELATVGYQQADGSTVEKDVPYISVYNLTAANPTNPKDDDYHPHAIDITGYDFENWYISEGHENGYKMVVEITRVEARDNVQWGRSTTTNHPESGLWLPADEKGNRELLLPFDQPTTIFVERAYVLDYGEEFTLSSWYFDDENGKDATAVHVDCDIENGMNWFDETAPNTTNAIGGAYGNTKYGNVRVENGEVHYSPTSMNWGGYDEFYIFGDTWRKTVLAQDANQNGNLWNKVTVIPANNIYYEDSFLTCPDTTVNGIEGFTFTGAWQIVAGDNAGNNYEIPEHLESAPYGDVHGWTDSLQDDLTFTDDSAHATGLNKEMGAKVSFTFTGTGVEVYTRTNAKSGMVVAMLTQHGEKEDGTPTSQMVRSVIVDNLAVSGDYYHIPTVSFDKLVYATYTLEIIATMASAEATGTARYEYYVDGVRIYNPLGNTTNYADSIVKEAYGKETNAVFTEVRDILLDNKDFNVDMDDGTDGKEGAVFIDWIREGQESGDDKAGVGVYTYEIGTFRDYGPKNEVYLAAGQAIVMKVDPKNTYYVGLKSLTGSQVTANVTGIKLADPQKITFEHSTDLYYQVTPVDGYIVIQNGSDNGSILSVTNLRTTNLTAPAPNGGVQTVNQLETVAFMRAFAARMAEKEESDAIQPGEPTEEETLSAAQQHAEAAKALALRLFGTVRTWLQGA